MSQLVRANLVGPSPTPRCDWRLHRTKSFLVIGPNLLQLRYATSPSTRSLPSLLKPPIKSGTVDTIYRIAYRPMKVLMCFECFLPHRVLQFGRHSRFMPPFG